MELTLEINAPTIVTAFIEIVPSDTVKYEIDKETGILKLTDHKSFPIWFPRFMVLFRKPMRWKVADYASLKSGKKVIKGDGDPLDICVLSERSVTHGDILLQAIRSVAFVCWMAVKRMIRLLQWWKVTNFIGNGMMCRIVRSLILNRLKHYFLTYKHLPSEKSICEITNVYGRDEAHEVIRRSMEDYKKHFSC